MRSFLKWTALAVILTAAAVCWRYWTKHNEKPIEFYTTSVTRGELIQTVTSTGVIKPILDILVSSQVSGYINKIFVDFNSPVKAHQVIATLDPAFYQAQVQSATADLENANANWTLQKVTVLRDSQLLAKSLLSHSDYDAAAALLGEAAAQVKIKEASLQSARTNLSYTTIYSPIDGIVINRAVDVGNTVAASLSAPTLFEIANDLSKMQIDASVAEADIGNVRDGEAVNFTVDAYPSREFHGRVYQVRNAPQTQQNVVIYDVMINVSNDELLLKPGMTANVSIVVARREAALRLANSGLRFRMPESVAFTPAAPDETAAPAVKKSLTRDEQRKAIRQIMLDSGYTPGGTQPPEVIQRAVALAKERGVQLPDRFLNAAHQPGAGRADAPVIRTVYVLPMGNPLEKPVAVHAKLGITDGTSTEILGGLKEGDIVITGLNLPSDIPRPASSPFGGGGFRRGF